MIQKRDAGLSIAVGFVMILMIIAMIIGMWAVVGVPQQIRDAEDYHAVSVTNSFLDYKIAVDNLRVLGWTGSNLSMLIPSASAYADGVLVMKEDVGVLSVSVGGVDYDAYDVSRLYATFGTTNTLVGYEGGGVFRNDYGYAAWVTPPSITLENAGDLYVTLVVPDMQGSFAVGSSEGIPVDTGLLSVSTPVDISTTETITITFTADDRWDAIVWNTFFYETELQYNNSGVNVVSDLDLSANTTSLEISPSLGGDIYLTVITPAYIVDVRRY